MLRFLGTIIVVACIVGCGYMFFYFDSKLKVYKRQLMAANNQVTKTQGKPSSDTLKTQSTTPKEVQIVYNAPTYKYGITLPYTAVYLAPVENSYIVNKLKDKLQVEILYEAEINKQTWFFISLGLDTNVNSKGWVRKAQVSMYIDDSTSNITTMSYR